MKSVFLILFLFHLSAAGYVNYNECPNKYLLLSADICSEFVLSKDEVSFIDATVKETPNRLGIFLKNKGLNIELNQGKPTIWILPLEKLNNPKLFSRFPYEIVGLNVVSDIYITPRALNVAPEDLRHELSHFFINNGLDHILDELIASEFEKIP